MRSGIVVFGAFACSACATTSFAPPVVNLERRLEADSSQICQPSAGDTDVATPGVDSARSLINNFVLVYRCRAHEAANGRQFFQVPSFLSLVGATAATAFGAGPDVAIAGGMANSVFNAGNAYYAPQRQAEIFDGSLDALLCIKTEAVGINAYDIGKLDEEETPEVADEEGGGGEGDSAIHVSPSQQYYDMIQAALFSVERVTAQRLNVVGTFDPAGVVAELTALETEIREKNKKKDGPAGDADADADAREGEAAADDEGGGGAGDDDLATVRIELLTLQPKLQRCVVRAKI